MIDRLPARAPLVDHQPVPVLGDPLAPRDLRCYRDQVPDQRRVVAVNVQRPADVRARDNQNVHGRLRPEVPKGDR